MLRNGVEWNGELSFGMARKISALWRGKKRDERCDATARAAPGGAKKEVAAAWFRGYKMKIKILGKIPQRDIHFKCPVCGCEWEEERRQDAKD